MLCLRILNQFSTGLLERREKLENCWCFSWKWPSKIPLQSEIKCKRLLINSNSFGLKNSFVAFRLSKLVSVNFLYWSCFSLKKIANFDLVAKLTFSSDISRNSVSSMLVGFRLLADLSSFWIPGITLLSFLEITELFNSFSAA